jgi:hypothetical protein
VLLVIDIIRGELPSSIQKKIFQYPGISNKCYRYESYIVPCENETYKVVKTI